MHWVPSDQIKSFWTSQCPCLMSKRLGNLFDASQLFVWNHVYGLLTRPVLSRPRGVEVPKTPEGRCH